MNDLPHMIAHEAAKLAFAETPYAEPLVGLLGPLLAPIVSGTLRLAGARDSAAASPDDIRKLFRVPPGVPANRALFDNFPPQHGNEADDATISLVQSAARVLATALRIPDLASPPSTDSEILASPARPPGKEPLSDLLGRLPPQDPLRTLLEELEKQGVLGLARQLQAASGATLAAAYSPDSVQQFLRKFGKVISDLYPKAVWILKYIEAEIVTASVRSAVVAGMAGAVEALPFSVKSNFKIGNRVHAHIQSQYRRTYSISHDIVIERARPNSLVEQIVVGPTTEQKAERLQDVARNRRLDPDFFFADLLSALAGWKLTIDDKTNSWLRADLIDANLLQIWEIKPIASGVFGVWQETLYRVSFNIMRVVKMSGGAPALNRRLLNPGSFVGMGPGLVLPIARGAYVLAPINVTYQAGGRPTFAIPFQLAIVPGLITYLVFNSRNTGKLLPVLLVLIAKGWKKFKEEMKQLSEKLKRSGNKGWREVADFLKGVDEEAVLKALLAVLIVMAVIIFVKTAPIWLPALAAGLLILLLLPDGGDQRAPEGTIAPLGMETSDLLLGPVMVRGLRNDQVGGFLAEFGKAFDDVAGAAGAAFEPDKVA